MEQSRVYSGTQLIARAFQLLKMFDDEHNEWSLNELVRESGLKKTTVFRILNALELEGVIQRTARGHYALGAEAIVLGGRAMRSNPLRKVTRPYLRKLVDLTKETATLETLWIDQNGMPNTMVIDEVLGPKLLGITQYIGMHFPAHMTSTGKVILAYETSEFVEQLLPTMLMAQTDNTITSPSQLQDVLVEARRQGFATSADELEVGIMGIAAPILDQNDQIQGALCVSGPSSRISPERQHDELVPLVRTMAVEISRKLGCRSM